MPQAGWCRECGEWIWVAEDGSCQNGHGSECVGGLYEAEPRKRQAPPEIGFGVGEMPDDLYRFNWAAFTLPFFWGIAHGVWPISLLVLGSVLMQFVLGEAMGVGSKTVAVDTLITWTVIAEAVSGIVRLWAGASANTLMWRRESLRLSLIPDALPRFGPARYQSRQRIWAIVGWVVLILGLTGTVFLNYRQWAAHGLAIVGAVEPLVFIGAEVWLGVWLSLKMRAERPGLPGTAEEPVEHTP